MTKRTFIDDQPIPEGYEDAARGPRYPQVKVRLTGENGNAFAILGRVRAAMRRAGLSSEQADEYVTEATAGDYDHLLAVTMRYVEVT